MGKSVASYSGHVLKLVPGDHQYSLPEFPIVIIWNGSDTFCPTQFVKANAITEWKMGIISRHLGEAIKLFEQVEPDVKHSHKKALSSSFKDLRNATILTDQLMGNTIQGHSQNIPPVLYGARKGTASDMTYTVSADHNPPPFFRHDVDPATLDPPQEMSAKSTLRPVAPRSVKIFAGFYPDPDIEFNTEDFYLPVEIFLAIPSAEARNIPVQPQPPPTQPVFPGPAPQQPVFTNPVQTQQPVFPTPVQVLSSRKSGQIAPTSTVTGPSVPVRIPMPPPPPPPVAPTPVVSATPSKSVSTPSSSSGYVKKFSCKFCKYSTDRKNDWENHCNRHTGQTFKCGQDGCKKVFSSPKNRDFHFKNVHLGIKRFTCPELKCNHQENDYGIMKVHLFESHGIGEECKCKFCDKKFGNWRVLDRHLNICQTEKNKKCPVCKKGYKDTERLVSHMQSLHTDSPRLICDKCGGVFTTQDSLRVHQATQHK